MTDGTIVLHPVAAVGILMAGLAVLVRAIPSILSVVAAFKSSNSRTREIADAANGGLKQAISEAKASGVSEVIRDIKETRQYLHDVSDTQHRETRSVVAESADRIEKAIREQTSALVSELTRRRR